MASTTKYLMTRAVDIDKTNSYRVHSRAIATEVVVARGVAMATTTTVTATTTTTTTTIATTNSYYYYADYDYHKYCDYSYYDHRPRRRCCCDCG